MTGLKSCSTVRALSSFSRCCFFHSKVAHLKPQLLALGGVEPIDLLLLLAASEEDAPKVAEVLRAGADLDAKVSILC